MKFINWIKQERNHVYVVAFLALVITCIMLGMMCSLLGGTK